MNAPGMGRSMQAGGTPEFMQKFLSDMQVSCECWSQFTSCMARSPKNSVSQDLNETLRHARQEASRACGPGAMSSERKRRGPAFNRSVRDAKRSGPRLLGLGEKLFLELTERALAELAKSTRDAHEAHPRSILAAWP